MISLNGRIKVYGFLAGLLLGLCFYTPVFASSPSYAADEESMSAASDWYLLSRDIYGLTGTELQNPPAGTSGAHFAFTQPINLQADPASTYGRYINGFLQIDYYLEFPAASGSLIPDVRDFQYTWHGSEIEHTIVAVGRPSLINGNSYDTFHCAVYLFFDNLYIYDMQPLNLGYFDLEFNGIFPLIVSGMELNVIESGTIVNDRTTISSSAEYSHGHLNSLKECIIAAINSATDLDTIVSLLTAINNYDASILSQLQAMYSTNLLIYDRLGAILDALSVIQSQTNNELSIVLTNISNNTTELNDALGDYMLPIVDINGIVDNVENRLDRNYLTHTPGDTVFAWQWIQYLDIGMWMLGLALSAGIVSYLVFGRPH